MFILPFFSYFFIQSFLDTPLHRTLIIIIIIIIIIQI